MIVNVEVLRHEEALNLLSHMARFGLIRFDPSCENATTVPGEKLSKRFAGALRLSDTRREEFQSIVREGRLEWTRDTC